MKEYNGRLAIFTCFYNYLAYSPYIRSLATTLGLLSRLGIRHEYLMEAANFHIEQAVNTKLTDLLDTDFTDVLLIDSDESWAAEDVVRLLLHQEEIVGATYRMKNKWETYVGSLVYKDGLPYGKILEDGTPVLLKANRIAGGFMRIKVSALKRWAQAYPELRYQDGGREVIGFFSRGVFDGEQHCQDMAFCRRWEAIGGEMWIDPHINIDHWGFDPHKGDFNAHLKSVHSTKSAFDTVREMAEAIQAR